MTQFFYEAQPGRVVFGAGSLSSVADEIEKLGCSRALILCTPRHRDQAEDVADLLGDKVVGIHDGAIMHVPVEAQEAAVAEAQRLKADCAVAVGGGSTIGLGKAIALKSDMPILAIPTTYAGSEMTPIWGLTQDGLKRTGRDKRVLPKTVIYDPALTLSLPGSVSGPSGLNAIAHSVEALYAQDTNPIISLMAEESIRALGSSLPKVVASPDDLEARSDALYGAWLAGTCLGAASMAIHHKLCHTLGGSYNLPHADVHTVIIPHATAYNRDAAPEAMKRVARALGVRDAAQGLYDLAVSVGAKVALKDIGMKEEDLDHAAELATQNPYYNPKPIEKKAIRALLENAFHGHRPSLAME